MCFNMTMIICNTIFLILFRKYRNFYSLFFFNGILHELHKDKGELFVSMPRYRSNERDESNGVIYKDVCNPITAEFREELYTNILDAYARIKEPAKEETQKQERTKEMPEFSVTVTPYEREGSNIKGLARI